MAWGAVRGNYQPVLFYVQFDGIAESALLNERFRNADSPGITDAHEFDSHKFHQFFMSDYIVITLALRVQPRQSTIAARLPRRRDRNFSQKHRRSPQNRRAVLPYPERVWIIRRYFDSGPSALGKKNDPFPLTKGSPQETDYGKAIGEDSMQGRPYAALCAALPSAPTKVTALF